MLLLLVFAVCVVSSSAQTVTPEAVQSTDSVVTILQTAVKSYIELNETTVGPVLEQVFEIIQGIGLAANFSLTVKNITRV